MIEKLLLFIVVLIGMRDVEFYVIKFIHCVCLHMGKCAEQGTIVCHVFVC